MRYKVVNGTNFVKFDDIESAEEFVDRCHALGIGEGIITETCIPYMGQEVHPGLVWALSFLRRRGERIRAVKLLLAMSGGSLIEAKNFVDSLPERT